MSLTNDQFRDITREFLSEGTHRSLNEVTHAGSDVRQLSLNQDEVDQILAMADALEPMFNELRQIRSIPQSWIESGDYEKIEEAIFDLPEELRELAKDMKKGGI